MINKQTVKHYLRTGIQLAAEFAVGGIPALSGVAWRILTQDCKGGKALNTAANLLCAAVLIFGAPKAWQLYWELRGEVTDLKSHYMYADIKGNDRDDKQDLAIGYAAQQLTELRGYVSAHAARDDARFDRLNERLSKVGK